ncbi:hypothetical protein CDD81_2370 [Ophiocordyceps australis]|uniref:Uncharacterized protein n=1 Tax=Ophiocordyceps australis TaxID=1399860 RepID=A0A2C5XZ70_9HYPO|nr:hypothetical protein CDD81_2370 [Ophiocordyceps australis]
MFNSGIKKTVLSGLAFALLTSSVAAQAQWTGSVNLTEVENRLDPREECWIASLATDESRETLSLQPCTCTGGKVSPDCNWRSDGYLWNRLTESVCKCADEKDNHPKGSEELQAYTEKQAAGVIGCLCDPPAQGATLDAEGLKTAGPACWCPADFLAEKTGLSVTENKRKPAPPAQPSTPAPPASTESCPIDWVIFPNNVNCSCRNPDTQKTCAPDASGNSQVLLQWPACTCGEYAVGEESDIKNCICTNALENEFREKCVCSPK